MIQNVVANELLWLSIMERSLEKTLEEKNTFSSNFDIHLATHKFHFSMYFYKGAWGSVVVKALRY